MSKFVHNLVASITGLITGLLSVGGCLLWALFAIGVPVMMVLALAKYVFGWSLF